MKNIFFLDMPAPPESLVNKILDFVNSVPIDPLRKKWFDDNYGYAANAIVDIPGLPLPDNIQKEVSALYRSYFNEPIIGIVTKFQNLNPGTPAAAPPHCDRNRKISINCMLQLGGDQVMTCFYHQKRKNPALDVAENASYDSVDLDFEVRFEKLVWHSYDVQTYHSVKNIDDSRIFLALLLDTNPDLATFTTKYKKLIKS